MTTHSNRRAIYRVHPDTRSDIVVSLVTPSGEVAASGVIDISINGACTRFSMGDARRVPTEGSVTLVLESPTLHERTEVQATVVGDEVSESEHRYSFRFDRADRLFQRASPEFFSLFNRRTAVRGVEPGADDGVRVALQLPPKFGVDTRYPARVRNISTTGMCVEVTADVDEEFIDTDAVEIYIDLPGRDETLHTRGRIRYREEPGDGATYGLMFVWSDSQESLDQIEDIAEYMLRRFEIDRAEMPH